MNGRGVRLVPARRRLTSAAAYSHAPREKCSVGAANDDRRNSSAVLCGAAVGLPSCDCAVDSHGLGASDPLQVPAPPRLILPRHDGHGRRSPRPHRVTRSSSRLRNGGYSPATTGSSGAGWQVPRCPQVNLMILHPFDAPAAASDTDATGNHMSDVRLLRNAVPSTFTRVALNIAVPFFDN
jgi:hypothetical protein